MADEVQVAITTWLSKRHPEDFQRIERYTGMPIMARSLGLLIVILLIIEAFGQWLTRAQLGLELSLLAMAGDVKFSRLGPEPELVKRHARFLETRGLSVFTSAISGS